VVYGILGDCDWLPGKAVGHGSSLVSLQSTCVSKHSKNKGFIDNGSSSVGYASTRHKAVRHAPLPET